MYGSFQNKSLGCFLLAVAVLSCVGAKAPTRAQQRSGSQPPDAGARERAAALRSPDALRRAAAAFELSKRHHEARALMGALVELLGDAAQVDPAAYRKGERWNEPAPITVGKEAARALVAVGAAAVGPLVAAPGRTAAGTRHNAD